MTTDPLQDIMAERHRQDAKWGVQNHSPEKWLIILGEEYGEACQALLDRSMYLYYREMVQVAAVALAALESLGRQNHLATEVKEEVE